MQKIRCTFYYFTSKFGVYTNITSHENSNFSLLMEYKNKLVWYF